MSELTAVDALVSIVSNEVARRFAEAIRSGQPLIHHKIFSDVAWELTWHGEHMEYLSPLRFELNLASSTDDQSNRFRLEVIAKQWADRYPELRVYLPQPLDWEGL